MTNNKSLWMNRLAFGLIQSSKILMRIFSTCIKLCEKYEEYSTSCDANTRPRNVDLQEKIVEDRLI